MDAMTGEWGANMVYQTNMQGMSKLGPDNSGYPRLQTGEVR